MVFNYILIVDDSSTSRMIIQRCFQIAGYDTAKYCFAENGLEAIAVLQGKDPIDLVVTDLNMPKMDGENFIKKLKSVSKMEKLPVFVITSTADDTTEKELKDMGVLGIIKKPVSPAKILEVIGGNNGKRS
jgi:two-component system chemotaxis response regulator CheY